MDYSLTQREQMQKYGDKVPFYLTFPGYENFEQEKEYEHDLERMKRFLPMQARLIQPLVEEECDKLEYAGSMMFDESPDWVRFVRICERILKQLPPQQAKKQEIKDLTAVLLMQEMYRRRCRHLRCQKWW